MKRRKYEVVSDLEHLPKEKMLEGIANSAVRQWAYILHDKDVNEDGTPVKPHWHVHVYLNDSYDSKYVARWFGVPEHLLEKIKDDEGSLEYLTHANRPEKHRYAKEEVVANFDLEEEIKKAKERKAKKMRLSDLLHGIDDGTIRRYNLYDYVSVEEYYSFARAIEKAFEYRTMRLRGADRNMQCIFITGQSGSGKTTYAKQLAENSGFSVFVSSGSNDVLDGYAGQECIILDDLRPSCMGLSDLLKMLDNNTSSTVKSRYFNKVLECKMIIITTTKSLETFFSEVFERENESAIQLMRRCETVVEMDTEKIVIKVWQKKSRQYKAFNPIRNFVLDQFKVEDMTEEQMLDKISEVLHLSADVVDELKNNGAEYLNGQTQYDTKKLPHFDELSDNPF